MFWAGSGGGFSATAWGASTSSSKDRQIVVLSDSARPAALADRLAARFGFRVGHIYRHALTGFSARMTESTAAILERLPEVEFVQRDRVVRTAGQGIPTGINRVDAELSPTAQIDGVNQRVNVDVAVLDTGVKRDHPDLVVYRTKNCSLSSLNNPTDQDGHGTHVAGTVAAKDNSYGVVGVAPGARIWAVKVLASVPGQTFARTVGLSSDLICGVDYVTANAGAIEVANMSLIAVGEDDRRCGELNDDALHRAICNSVTAGVTYAVAAGNEDLDVAGFVPAAYDEVITTSALADFNGRPGGGAAPTCRKDAGTDDHFASFSNHGLDVDLIAPGVCIRSTSREGGYVTRSGTSTASPHAAGAAALYAARHPLATPAEVKAALQNAGTLNWFWPSEDGDEIQEKLVNVFGF